MSTPYCAWDDEYWETLIHAIAHNNCILMLGPDAATQKVNGQEQPLSEILANKFLEKIDGEAKDRINVTDLAQVSQYYYMKQGRMGLEARVKSFYKDRQSLMSVLHRNLAEIPFYFTVTTSHDNMLCSAMEIAGKKPSVARFHFRGKNPPLVKMGTAKEPLIYYLFGSVVEPYSMVLTENNLLDFLEAVISKKHKLPENVLSELRDKSKCFLFLGFGFRHWYLRILLHVLQGQDKASLSFAMEEFEPKYEGCKLQLKQTVFFFRNSDFNIHIFNKNFEEFVLELRNSFGNGDDKPSSPKPQEPITVPKVFISYASEDEEFAKFSYSELESAGFNPWLDKEELRGGDQWDQKIKSTLDEVDYVVVVQSQALSERVEGYVFKEINYALERQQGVRRGIRFIIPLKIDESPLLEELKAIQTINLADTSNLCKVIDTIERDWKKRRTQ